jgi:hypothetical protein
MRCHLESCNLVALKKIAIRVFDAYQSRKTNPLVAP